MLDDVATAASADNKCNPVALQCINYCFALSEQSNQAEGENRRTGIYHFLRASNSLAVSLSTSVCQMRAKQSPVNISTIERCYYLSVP